MLSDLGVAEHADMQTRHLVFVTLYLNGAVVASSGRVHAIQKHTLSECIDNAVLALKDSRAGAVTAANLANVRIRVDIVQSSDRRLVANHSELNPREEGMILLSQNLAKLAVVLPKIVTPGTDSLEIFRILCQKAGMPMAQDPADYVLYAIRSTVYTDF
jgi:AMMECR1 domain-containing protein